MVRDVRHSLALNSEIVRGKKNYDVSFFNRVCVYICYVLTRRLREDKREASSRFLVQSAQMRMRRRPVPGCQRPSAVCMTCNKGYYQQVGLISKLSCIQIHDS